MHVLVRDGCPICGARSTDLLCDVGYNATDLQRYLRDYYRERGGVVDWEMLEGARYQVASCSRCETLFQVQVPDDLLAERLYEHWIDPEHSRTRSSESRVIADLALQVLDLLRLVGCKTEGARMLDYGMGWGQWCRVARGLGGDVAGVELSVDRQRHAKSMGLRVTTLEDEQPASYDVINAEQVFEHLPSPLDTAVQLRELLKPGGVLRIGVPSAVRARAAITELDWSIPKGSRGSIHVLHPLEHLNCFSQHSLQELGGAAGFDVIHRPWHLHAGLVPWWSSRGDLRRCVVAAIRQIRDEMPYVWMRRPLPAS